MVDAARPRQLEFYNPRPLILGVCFFWGVIMGFCLFYFSPPQDLSGRPNPVDDDPVAVPVDTTRRLPELPSVTNIPEAPDAIRNNKVTIEEYEVTPPQAVLTTEGGITGKTAKAPGSRSTRPNAPPRAPATSPMAPPIPELMP